MHHMRASSRVISSCRQWTKLISKQRTSTPTTTTIRKRYRYTLAIARQLPDSFPNAISSGSSSSVDGDNDNEEDKLDMGRAKQHHEDYVQALRQCVAVLELPAMTSSSSSSTTSTNNKEMEEQSDHEKFSETGQRDSNIIRNSNNNDYPDCAFVEDTVIAIGQYALITRLGHESRRGEEKAVCATLKQLGMNVLNMNDYYNSTDWIYGRGRSNMSGMRSDPVQKGELATVDGGDVLYTERHIYVGLSDRTNIEGARFVRNYFNSYNVIVVPKIEINDPNIKLSHPMPLHLKSAVTHIDSETLLMPEGPYGDALVVAMNTKEYGYKVHRVPDLLSCNVISCNGQVMVQDTLCERSQEILYDAVMDSDQDLLRVDTSELAKKDAALTCCSVLLQV